MVCMPRFFFLFIALIGGTCMFSCAQEPPLPQRQDREFLHAEQVRGDARTGNCTVLATFYEDADGDGFGNPAKTVKGCTAPPGYVADGTDCADDEPRAFPGQTQFFHMPRPDGSYDFDCDGKSSIRLTQRAACEEDPAAHRCSAVSGWEGRVPDCGQAGEWSWNECRTELVSDPPSAGDMPPDAVQISIPSPQKTVSHCWSSKLAWKKRQTCR